MRAHRDALLVVRDPADDLMPEQPCPLGNTTELLAALHRRGQHPALLILRDRQTPCHDRAVTGPDREHPDLVRPRLRADLRPPLLRLDAVRRGDLPAAQQFRVIAARTVEVVVGDPTNRSSCLGLTARLADDWPPEREPTWPDLTGTGTLVRGCFYAA